MIFRARFTSRLRVWTVLLFALSGGPAIASARHFIVFDLDRTLFDPNPRIAKILHEVGTELGIPGLLHATPAQVAAWVGGDRSAFGLNEATLRTVFGSYHDGTHRTSPFGRRFYFDPAHIAGDPVIPGAPEFVERISRHLDAGVIYLSGRIDERMRSATLSALARHDFPGFGKHADRRNRVKLILKREADPLSNDEFKLEELKRAIGDGRVVAVFDDSSRNLLRFREWLGDRAVIVRLTPSAAKGAAPTQETGLRIRDYVSDPGLIEQILNQAKACSLLLGG